MDRELKELSKSLYCIEIRDSGTLSKIRFSLSKLIDLDVQDSDSSPGANDKAAKERELSLQVVDEKKAEINEPCVGEKK